MYGLEVERRHIAVDKTLSVDIASHFSRRYGQAIVVTDRPVNMMAAVKKQWIRLEHKLKIERARSLDHERIRTLCEQLEYMQGVKFSAKPPEDMLCADITFATADDFVATSSLCQTVYVTYEFMPVKLHMLTSWMPREGLIVIYDE
jgi:hypothetical protein